jgi:hypothetical protein
VEIRDVLDLSLLVSGRVDSGTHAKTGFAVTKGNQYSDSSVVRFDAVVLCKGELILQVWRVFSGSVCSWALVQHSFLIFSDTNLL